MNKDNIEGKKYDSGKPMVGTILRIFPRALSLIGAVIEHGTHKYPAVDNWIKNKDIIERYTDSLVRHLTKHFIGEVIDKDSGLPHLAHVSWNSLAILEYYLRQNSELVNKVINIKENKDED